MKIQALTTCNTTHPERQWVMGEIYDVDETLALSLIATKLFREFIQTKFVNRKKVKRT